MVINNRAVPLAGYEFQLYHFLGEWFHVSSSAKSGHVPPLHSCSRLRTRRIVLNMRVLTNTIALISIIIFINYRSP